MRLTVFLDYGWQTFLFEILTKFLGSSITKLRSLAITFQVCSYDESVYYQLRTLEQLEELIFVAPRTDKGLKYICTDERVIFKPISESSFDDMNHIVNSYYFDPYSVLGLRIYHPFSKRQMRIVIASSHRARTTTAAVARLTLLTNKHLVLAAFSPSAP